MKWVTHLGEDVWYTDESKDILKRKHSIYSDQSKNILKSTINEDVSMDADGGVDE